VGLGVDLKLKNTNGRTARVLLERAIVANKIPIGFGEAEITRARTLLGRWI
jgi:hypothetical protein